MLTVNRTLLIASCLMLVASTGCGGGPTAPGGGGTTIAGTVNVNGGAASARGGAASGLTVTIVGTNLSAVVESSGYFQLVSVPSGNVRLLFKDAIVNATAELTNVGQESLIEIQVHVTNTTATIVSELRTDDKVSLCHRSDESYHQITVSVNAESAHRAHGDGKVGDPVPADTTKVFGENCQPSGPSVRLEKSTNGEDADDAPGPTIPVGGQVNWTFVVTNTGTVPLTNVKVTDDDQNVAVSCPGTTLGVGQSMTCTGSGFATAGQYRNIGTVEASWTSGIGTDTDASHYFGQTLVEEEGPKVQLCHRTGNGSYHLIEVSINAEPAHRAHGDGKIGEAVPGQLGKVFGAGCSVS
jgi:hypothetical protein